LDTLFSKGCAFMPYVCCGDPDAEFTKDLIRALVRGGAGAIELGIPFSDPIADGKTIQEASQRALSGGLRPGKALALLKELRDEGMDAPVLLMTYYNLIFSRGLGRFVREAKAAGADGLIVPDLPIEECEELARSCVSEGLDLVQFITPATSDERIAKIAEKAGGFLYAVAVIGITGARDSVSEGAVDLIERGRRISGKRVVVGFGISTPEQARRYAEAGADGIIVGSHLVRIYSEALAKGGREAALEEAAALAGKMAEAICAPQTRTGSPGTLRKS